MLIVLLLILSLGMSAQSGNEVLILGTQHLSHIDGFEPSMLDAVIDKLCHYEFDVIAVESMPAMLLYDIRSRNDKAFEDVLGGWGGKRIEAADAYQQAMNISFAEAAGRADSLLSLPQLKSSDRKALIMLSLAAGDPVTASLQHAYLLQENEAAQGGLPDSTSSYLAQLSRSPNEIYSLAMALAKNTAVQKIDHIDNFQDEALLLKHYPRFIEECMEDKTLFSGIAGKAVYLKTDSIQRSCVVQRDLLPLYDFLNSTAYQAEDVDAQWAVWLNTDFASGADKARYSLWEMRNLQIAANIMHTAAMNPGKRILVVIGASHKSFLEKYLDQAGNIKLLKFE